MISTSRGSVVSLLVTESLIMTYAGREGANFACRVFRHVNDICIAHFSFLKVAGQHLHLLGAIKFSIEDRTLSRKLIIFHRPLARATVDWQKLPRCTSPKLLLCYFALKGSQAAKVVRKS